MAGILRQLRLSQFRCFDSLDLAPGPFRTFVVGRNAQGKTSILEAACILLRLQSPRTSTLAEAVKFGCSACAIDGRFGDTHLAFHWQDGTRRIALDSKPQTRPDDYLNTARVAWFANSDLDLVRGGGSARRRYLDFLGIQSVPGYRSALRAFERALRSRNALLRDNRPRKEIEAFDHPLAENGDALTSFRAGLCRILAPLANSACGEISGSSDTVALSHQPGASSPLLEALAASQEQEIRLRQTIVGPHRDDVTLLVNNAPAASFASEGQQRSLAIALKLAQARHLESVLGVPPILLLDDVFGELDADRRNRLLEALPRGAQAIITTTFLDWTGPGPDDVVLALADGRLSSAS
jgi:DNA replication and repair protein RecF